MNLNSIKRKMLYRRQGNTEGDTNFEAMITEWANEALKDIWMGKGLEISPNWWFLEVSYSFETVANQMTYDLPTQIDGKKMKTLREKTNDRKLIYLDQRDLDRFFPDPSVTSGIPTHYTIFGRDTTTERGYVRLLPIASSAITIYERFYTDMDEYDNDDDDSTVLLPDKYDTVLLDGILSKWYEFDPEMGNYEKKLKEFILGIEKANEDNKSIDNPLVADSHGNLQRALPGFSYPVEE